MKYLILSVQLLITAYVSGQKVSFSASTIDYTNTEIAAICELWRKYVTDTACLKIEDFKKYWNNDEIDEGFTDIVVSATPFGSYRNSEVSVLEVVKINSLYYRIRSVLTIKSGLRKPFETMFNVYAKKEESGFRLCNSFLIERPFLYHYKTGNIDYYISYARKWALTTYQADDIVRKYRKILYRYGLSDKNRVIYIMGATLEEAFRLIGVFYTPLGNPIYKGYFIENQDIILSTSETHLHELIHSIFNKYKGSVLFQEGIATYYGGSSGKSYDQQMSELIKVIRFNPGIDLTDYRWLSRVKNREFYSMTLGMPQSYYIIGAIFIDYALRTGGEKKVLALFNYNDLDNSVNEGFYTAIEKELGIKKEQVNSFLVNFILNYKKK